LKKTVRTLRRNQGKRGEAFPTILEFELKEAHCSFSRKKPLFPKRMGNLREKGGLIGEERKPPQREEVKGAGLATSNLLKRQGGGRVEPEGDRGLKSTQCGEESSKGGRAREKLVGKTQKKKKKKKKKPPTKKKKTPKKKHTKHKKKKTKKNQKKTVANHDRAEREPDPAGEGAEVGRGRRESRLSA